MLHLYTGYSPIQVTRPIWATKYYVWATMFQFLGAQVATKDLKSVWSSDIALIYEALIYCFHCTYISLGDE